MLGFHKLTDEQFEDLKSEIVHFCRDEKGKKDFNVAFFLRFGEIYRVNYVGCSIPIDADRTSGEKLIMTIRQDESLSRILEIIDDCELGLRANYEAGRQEAEYWASIAK